MKGMALGGAGRAEDGRTGLGPPTPQAFLLPPLWTPSFPTEPVSLITCRDWEARTRLKSWGCPGSGARLSQWGQPCTQGELSLGDMPDGPQGRQAGLAGTQWRFRAHFQGQLPDAVSWTPGIGSRDREPLQVVTSRWKRGRGGGWCEMMSEHWQERTPVPREPETPQEWIYCAVHPLAREHLSTMCQEPRTE